VARGDPARRAARRRRGRWRRPQALTCGDTKVRRTVGRWRYHRRRSGATTTSTTESRRPTLDHGPVPHGRP
jgi:hypothetical protein